MQTKTFQQLDATPSLLVTDVPDKIVKPNVAKKSMKHATYRRVLIKSNNAIAVIVATSYFLVGMVIEIVEKYQVYWPFGQEALFSERKSILSENLKLSMEEQPSFLV